MDSKEHLVSLKVMRLLKPSLYSSLPIHTESEHFSDNFSKMLLDQVFDYQSIDELNSNANFCMSDFLVIPQIFGNLYIGETFTSYICLHNHSLFKVKQLNIKVELQTTSQKVVLPFKSKIDSVDEFEPDQKFDGIVEYDVKELGNHILVCIVSYLNDKMEKLSFKKFYKFIVSKPFEIQPRYPFIENQSYLKDHSILFEAQIQNITNSVLYMENVKLHPLKVGIRITEVKTDVNEDINSHMSNKIYDKSGLLRPSEVRQYLFKVTYEDLEKEKKPLQVGKLDISWRYSMGENGHLQTHPLEQPNETVNFYQKEIELAFVDLPKKCVINQTCVFTCIVQNKTDRELDLVMKLTGDKSDGYVWNCALSHEIGKIMPKSTHSVKLNIIPTQSGLISLSGITITDLFLKRLHEFTKVCHMYVLAK